MTVAVFSLSAPTTQVTPSPAPAPEIAQEFQQENPVVQPAQVVEPPEVPLKPLQKPKVKAVSAILIDAVSGQVLFEKNARLRRPMASTTKIMTGLLLCENLLDTDIITASKKAAHTPESSLNLRAGEKLTARDMLRALMLRSANDGCVAVAEHIAGSEAAFAKRMTERAAEIGATDTNFVNSHGLHNPNHYTTAADLAKIARIAMQNERFASTVCLKTCKIDRSLNKKDLWMKNRSKFLTKFPGADGVKTGWTTPAGKCYVGSATYGGWRLISVVLKSSDYVEDTRALMKFGFNNYEPRVVAKEGDENGVCPVLAGESATVPVALKERLQVALRKDAPQVVETRRQVAEVTAPVLAGEAIGSLEAVVDGKVLSAAPLVATEAVAPVAMMARVAPSGGIGKNALVAASILATCLVSLRYGTRTRFRLPALAKSARRRRRRFTQSLRGDDRHRTSHRQRQEDFYSWHED